MTEKIDWQAAFVREVAQRAKIARELAEAKKKIAELEGKAK